MTRDATDRNITWLGDANFGAGSAFDNGGNTTDGRMTWDNAVAWVDSLTVGGFTDWRDDEKTEVGSPHESAEETYSFHCRVA